ncbi:MAG: PepSY-associated TM helix domain-containing protein [Acidobacteriota bacterium]
MRGRVPVYTRHIYLSMTSFVIVLFFAVTGITLNHPDWFADLARTTQAQGSVDAGWTNTGSADVRKTEIVASLRRRGVIGAVGEFRVDDQQYSVSFKGPGYSADATIDRLTGKYDLTESWLGLVAVLNDLHKGRDTGAARAVVIDLAAGLLALVSLTGLVLLYFIHKHRVAGIVLLLFGGALAALAYRIWVP